MKINYSTTFTVLTDFFVSDQLSWPQFSQLGTSSGYYSVKLVNFFLPSYISCDYIRNCKQLVQFGILPVRLPHFSHYLVLLFVFILLSLSTPGSASFVLLYSTWCCRFLISKWSKWCLKYYYNINLALFCWNKCK